MPSPCPGSLDYARKLWFSPMQVRRALSWGLHELLPDLLGAPCWRQRISPPGVSAGSPLRGHRWRIGLGAPRT